MLGDVLKREISKLQFASTKKSDKNAFWILLRDIAVQEIIELDEPVDSDVIIPVYYEILCDNERFIPDFFKEINPSNGQTKYRVANRNLFSSNAFHPDGLANQNGISAFKEINESKKGYRIVYKKA